MAARTNRIRRPIGELDCVVISLGRRPALLEQFRRRWARVSTRPVEVFRAVEDADPRKGCYDSHLNVLARTSRPVAIFEDDALFSLDFTLDLMLPCHADVIYLGGEHLAPPERVAKGWVAPTNIARTHAYIAMDPQKLVTGLLDRTHDHVDAALNALDVPKLALSPFTVGQAAGVSSISGKNFPFNRFWND